MINANPFLGVGTGQYRVLSSEYINLPSHLYGFSAHSTWLQLLAENGFIGLFVFMILIYTILEKRSCQKTADENLINIALVSAIVAFFITGLFNHNLYIAREAMLLWAFFGLYLALNK